jgi:DNA phosphorothioation-associated DGQHR protein 1
MYFFKGKATLVRQPFGSFYIASIPAEKLVKICYSFAASFGDEVLTGIQRGINEKRIGDIGRFCTTEFAMFPTSIILSANLLKDGSDINDEDIWYINESFDLIIPSNKEYASIVDGQHRIAGLKKAIDSGALISDFDLVCAVYFELPAPKQAEVFATINFNQQKVDKDLAYQLFGYDLDSDDSKYWAPDTLAIYLSRLLDKEEGSPFEGKIDFGMKKTSEVNNPKINIPEANEDPDANEYWKISTSAIVEGITRLISSNPTKDRYLLHKKRLVRKDRSILRENPTTAPLRENYLMYQDGQLYDLIVSYFNYCKDVFWLPEYGGIMKKTIAIQALFDLLKAILQKTGYTDNLNFSRVRPYMEKIDPKRLTGLSANYSGSGRTAIKKLLLDQIEDTALATSLPPSEIE